MFLCFLEDDLGSKIFVVLGRQFDEKLSFFEFWLSDKIKNILNPSFVL
jgi:hypothetical protein